MASPTTAVTPASGRVGTHLRCVRVEANVSVSFLVERVKNVWMDACYVLHLNSGLFLATVTDLRHHEAISDVIQRCDQLLDVIHVTVRPTVSGRR